MIVPKYLVFYFLYRLVIEYDRANVIGSAWFCLSFKFFYFSHINFQIACLPPVLQYTDLAETKSLSGEDQDHIICPFEQLYITVVNTERDTPEEKIAFLHKFWCKMVIVRFYDCTTLLKLEEVVQCLPLVSIAA